MKKTENTLKKSTDFELINERLTKLESRFYIVTEQILIKSRQLKGYDLELVPPLWTEPKCIVDEINNRLYHMEFTVDVLEQIESKLKQII